MEFLMYALAAGAGVLFGLVILALAQPGYFTVSRAVVIDAPAELVHGYIADLARFQSWSPWEHKDPAMARTLSKPSSGVGARYAWDGNRDVGAGSLTITDIVPASRVGMALAFVRPMEATNEVTFTLAKQVDGTLVTWTMGGVVPLVGRIVHVFCNMDRMIGRDFEAGLANLKALAERDAADAAGGGPTAPHRAA